MKINQNNLVYIVIFLVGVFIYHGVIFQNHNMALSTEISSDHNSITNFYCPEIELHEEDQIFGLIKIQSVESNYNHPAYFHDTFRLPSTSLLIWQPPKIS